MKTGTITHPKFRRLQKKLKLPTYAVAGLLELVWMLTTQFAAEDGDLTRFSAQEIGDYCDYEGDADSLVDALVETKWLDRDADSLRVHDWVDHRPSFIEDRIRIRESRRKPNDSEGCSETVRSGSRTLANNRPLPSQAKPSQANSSPTQPNQAKPSQTKPDEAPASALAGNCRQADFGFSAEGNDRLAEILQASQSLDKCFGKLLESADLVWQIAWVGVCCREGAIPEIVDTFKKRKGTEHQVKQPRKWIDGCLRKELARVTGIEAKDIDLDQVFSMVQPWKSIKK